MIMNNQDSKPVILGKLTRKEFRERMESGELKACIIPTAATEQHLEHLAMEHDYRSIMHISELIAKEVTPHVLVAPVMNIGISEHHMKHPGTLSALPGSWLSVLFDGIRSMNQAGFTNILVLNGHGGNIAPCEGMWGQYLQRLEINLQFASYWDFLPEEIAFKHLETKEYPGHAQEFETAIALAAFPENVRHDAMSSQKDQAPIHATAEAGKAMIDATVQEIAKHIRGMIAGTETVDIPPYMP